MPLTLTLITQACVPIATQHAPSPPSSFFTPQVFREQSSDLRRMMDQVDGDAIALITQAPASLPHQDEIVSGGERPFVSDSFT